MSEQATIYFLFALCQTARANPDLEKLKLEVVRAALQTRHVLGDLGRTAQEPVHVDVDDARDLYILRSKKSGGAKPNTDNKVKLGVPGRAGRRSWL